MTLCKHETLAHIIIKIKIHFKATSQRNLLSYWHFLRNNLSFVNKFVWCLHGFLSKSNQIMAVITGTTFGFSARRTVFFYIDVRLMSFYSRFARATQLISSQIIPCGIEEISFWIFKTKTKSLKTILKALFDKKEELSNFNRSTDKIGLCGIRCLKEMN